MIKFIVITIVLINIYLANGFTFKQFKQISTIIKPSRAKSYNNPSILTHLSATNTKDNSINLSRVINPSKFDVKAVFTTLAGQGLLLNIAFLVGSLIKLDVLHLDSLSTELEILQETVPEVLGITGIVIAMGFLLRDFPNQTLQTFFRERKFFVLKTLGIKSPPQVAVAIAAVIAFGEAFSDELFFRGLCFSSIHQYSGDTIALFVSALICGLAHYPVFGSNIIVESGLGLIYGYSFLYGKMNIVVPIIIHAIYSLVSMYMTWYFATQDIRQRILKAEKNTGSANSDVEFEAIAKAIFDIIDLDKSGFICAKELKLGLKLFGFGPEILDEKLIKGTNYEVILKLQNPQSKEISYDSFVEILKEGLATWPRFDDNLDYFSK